MTQQAHPPDLETRPVQTLGWENQPRQKLDKTKPKPLTQPQLYYLIAGLKLPDMGSQGGDKPNQANPPPAGDPVAAQQHLNCTKKTLWIGEGQRRGEGGGGGPRGGQGGSLLPPLPKKEKKRKEAQMYFFYGV